MNKIKCCILFIILFFENCFTFADSLDKMIRFYSTLTDSEIKTLEEKIVYFPNQLNAESEPIIFEGEKLPPILISSSFISDSLLRYKISCYLINKLEIGLYFPIADYDSFLENNKCLIAESVYYFYHKNYGAIFKQYPSNSDNLFTDSQFQDELDIVAQKLKGEGSFLPYVLRSEKFY